MSASVAWPVRRQEPRLSVRPTAGHQWDKRAICRVHKRSLSKCSKSAAAFRRPRRRSQAVHVGKVRNQDTLSRMESIRVQVSGIDTVEDGLEPHPKIDNALHWLHFQLD